MSLHRHSQEHTGPQMESALWPVSVPINFLKVIISRAMYIYVYNDDIYVGYFWFYVNDGPLICHQIDGDGYMRIYI